MKSNDNQNTVKGLVATQASWQPSRLIEPETSTLQTKGDGINWEPWERDYREKLGIELTEADKVEIKASINAFFGLLKEIDMKEKTR